jgi:ArsR family transcriptional regulator, arsenate/arsenite/antimonite-responsive transcriptional repressor
VAARKTAVLDSTVCCTPVRTGILDEDQATVLATSFAALADPIRLRLLSCIAAAGGDEVCACDLLEPSGRSQPTVSHHMKILYEAGLVTRDKRGLWVWYRLVPERLDALRSALG